MYINDVLYVEYNYIGYNILIPLDDVMMSLCVCRFCLAWMMTTNQPDSSLVKC